MDDDLVEIDKVFTASLELVNGNDADRVLLQPVEASVTILDDDSECMEARALRYFLHKVAFISNSANYEGG